MKNEEWLDIPHPRTFACSDEGSWPTAYTMAEALVSWASAKRVPDRIVWALYGGDFSRILRQISTSTNGQVNPSSLWNLYQLVLSTSGPVCEVGVYRGASAMILARMDPDVWLVDSFEGLSPPIPADAMRADDGLAHCSHGNFDTSLDEVKKRLPTANIIKGWVPEALNDLPDKKWGLVHIDLDRAAPTRAAIEYFKDRMLPGGVIVEDQLVSTIYPGPARAWRESGLEIHVLPTGQGVYFA
jgi:hypothetical protein